MLTPGFCVNFGGFGDILLVVRFYSRLALIQWGLTSDALLQAGS